jgi:hypothetical protein
MSFLRSQPHLARALVWYVKPLSHQNDKIRGLIVAFQVFSPATMIFSGIGILFLVSILFLGAGRFDGVID